MNAKLQNALRIFHDAYSYIDAAGFSEEVDEHRRVDFEHFTERDLLREHAWVTLCSGFKENTVRKVFDHVSLCYCDWESAEEIFNAGAICCETASSVFRNMAKLNAILSASAIVRDLGFLYFKDLILRDPLKELQRLPFIGPITSRHLAKNLGVNVCKPDRHLVRLSKTLGFRDSDHLCGAVADLTGTDLKIVDFVFWRYLADKGGIELLHHLIIGAKR